jgi:hypothetical protein
LTTICFDYWLYTLFQLQPGSKIPSPIVISPKFATPIFPFSDVRVSSGEESKLFFYIFVDIVITKSNRGLIISIAAS